MDRSITQFVKKPQNQDKKFKLLDKKELSETKLRMINQTAEVLILNGFNIAKTAKKLRITPEGIYKRLSRYPEIKEKVIAFNNTTTEIARERIKASTINASDAIINLMDSTQSERMKLDSAIQILDRAGITKPDTNIQVNVLNNLRKDKDDYNL